MSRLGFNNNNNNKRGVVVYNGEVCLGELEVIPTADKSFQFPNNEIRIHHMSSLSERCPPLSVLLAVSSVPVRCKLEPSEKVEKVEKVVNQQLLELHAACFYELKTAVVLIGDEEVHLVAMPSKLKRFPSIPNQFPLQFSITPSIITNHH